MFKKFNKRSIFYIILAVLIIYILFLDNSSFLQRFKYHLRVRKLEKDMENLQTENEQLTEENLSGGAPRRPGPAASGGPARD